MYLKGIYKKTIYNQNEYTVGLIKIKENDIDEGLNEIDISLERQILLNIFRNNSDKIIVIVSHRLENIDLFDKVILMSNGTIKKVYVKRE